MKRLVASVTALAAAGVAFVGTSSPAAAATEQCADYQSPNKVELNYETTTVQLDPGTIVCYKAGTQVFTVQVGSDGVLTSQATNKFGRLLAISYYVVTTPPPPPPV